MEKQKMSWVPLESNPEVMTKLFHKLGVPTKWNIVDVYGLEPDLLAILTKPVLAMILLYPLSDTEKNRVTKEDNETNGSATISPNVYYLKQFISNACGTIALIHSLANNVDKLDLQDGMLKSFLEETKNLSPTERGERLMSAGDIADTHKEFAREGQTEVPDESYHHFVTFVEKDGHIYELDGRRDGPINHGVSSPSTFLEDAARVCKEYMKRNPDEMGFSVLVLTPA
ncbi:ubiquitin carboxyl-terminal hydrolase-like [Leptopilina heterotoma]|uniref:ubiquitin carboxyl-terminal hydrolase-like n=1 Tax=Leptopilina heterotoma TaxID=63436 RepID=UPI001CAA36FA|nr:ubiquitin carboxyl-terminal hydrolase-like [Leptopilina heterotoma]